MTKIFGYFTVLLEWGNGPNYNTFFSLFCRKQDSLAANIKSQLYNLKRK